MFRWKSSRFALSPNLQRLISNGLAYMKPLVNIMLNKKTYLKIGIPTSST